MPVRLASSACALILWSWPTLLGAAEVPGSRPLERLVPQRIANGLTTIEYPHVVALLSSNRQLCSGTLIGCQTVLTAAQCVCATVGVDCQGGRGLVDPGGITVYLQHGGFVGVDAIDVPPSYEPGVASDVALLHLSNPVDGIAPAAINATQVPPFGQSGQIVGFGLSQGDRDDQGVKRLGVVEVATCTEVPQDQHVCWQFAAPVGPPGDDSTTCGGDAGGPLFVDLGVGSVIAGVTSGSSDPLCLPSARAWDADVFQNRSWIEANAGAIGQASCGHLAQAGTDGAPLFFGEGTLDASNPDDVWSLVLPVPPGGGPPTTVLRIALNGEDGLANDIDLSVKLGAPPTASDYDCRSAQSGTYEFCEIEEPVDGVFFFRVELTGAARGAAGSVFYQLATTPFSVNPLIFADGFEPGDTSAWSATVP